MLSETDTMEVERKKNSSCLDNMTVGAQGLIELRDYCVHSESEMSRSFLFFLFFYLYIDSMCCIIYTLREIHNINFLLSSSFCGVNGRNEMKWEGD